jgi:hypothetical protein
VSRLDGSRVKSSVWRQTCFVTTVSLSWLIQQLLPVFIIPNNGTLQMSAPCHQPWICYLARKKGPCTCDWE